MTTDDRAAKEAEELPGMWELANAVREQKWPHTVDASVWAQEWMRTIKDHADIPTDEGAMIGWFANAIMAGYDTAQSRDAAEIARLRAENERLEGQTIAGTLQVTLADHIRLCEMLIAEEQQRPNCDTALICVLRDSVRLMREYVDSVSQSVSQLRATNQKLWGALPAEKRHELNLAELAAKEKE